MVGLALWDSKADYDRYVASEAESERRHKMSAYIDVLEWEKFFDVSED